MRLLSLLAVLSLLCLPAAAHAGTADNTLILELEGGTVEIKMMPNLAPKHVAQVKQLTRMGFYDGLEWFRVIDGFMAQTGYPKGKKGGKSDLPDLPAEFSKYKFKRGTVGMGRSDDPNSANSQFFVCFTDNGCADLTGTYTAWGQVTKGMDVIDSLKRGEPPSNPDKTLRARIASDPVDAVQPTAPSPSKSAGNQ